MIDRKALDHLASDLWQVENTARLILGEQSDINTALYLVAFWRSIHQAKAELDFLRTVLAPKD